MVDLLSYLLDSSSPQLLLDSSLTLDSVLLTSRLLQSPLVPENTK